MARNEVYLLDRFILRPDSGEMDMVHQAKLVLHGATAQVVYHLADGTKHHLCLRDARCMYRVEPLAATLSAGDDHLALTWHIGLQEQTCLTLHVRNRGTDPVYLDELTVLQAGGKGLDLGGRPADWRFYHNGWQSWSAAFTCLASGPLPAHPTGDAYRNKHLPIGAADSPLTSDSFTIIRGSDLALLAGFITTSQHILALRLDVQDSAVRSLAATCAADGAVLAPGETLVSEVLLLAADSSPAWLMDLYLSELAESMHARVPDHVPTGWCTWYYYYGENSEDDVLANVARIKELGLPLEYVLIDDGYQAALGDWTRFSDHFPHGMPWLLDQIRAAGLKPGLWLAPFGAAHNSRLYADHQDWVLTGDDGAPIVAWQHTDGQDVHALDCTHPAVQDWLADLFRTWAEDWGVELFKIDFCFAAALPGRRHDPTSTRASALRRGLEVIRDAVGERFLLGCGLPLGPAVGIVDAMRIGTDVSFYWKPLAGDPTDAATENALRNTITRSAFHGRLWLNDPDCVMVRPRGDSTDLRAQEVSTLCAVAALSGGLLLDGDNLQTLPPGRVRLLQRLLPPAGATAAVVDLFDDVMPCLLVLPCDGSAGAALVVAVINWADETVSTELDVPAFLGEEAQPGVHVYDLLAERYIGLASDIVTFDRHLPHATLLLLLKPATAQPALLASSFHLLGGLVEVKQVSWQNNRLIVRIEKPGRQTGKLAFAVPEPYRLMAVRINERRHTWREADVPGVVEVRFTFQDQAVVELEFV